MIKEMKVLVRDNDFGTKYPDAERDIDNLGGLVGVNEDGYARFSIEGEEDFYPGLAAALRDMGIADNETVLVEFY